MYGASFLSSMYSYFQSPVILKLIDLNLLTLPSTLSRGVGESIYPWDCSQHADHLRVNLVILNHRNWVNLM